MLYWIDVGYACFVIIVKNSIVVDAPPIARWAIGKKSGYVLNYYRKKKGRIIKC